MVEISGFDTHANQTEDVGDPAGKHHELLHELSLQLKCSLTI